MSTHSGHVECGQFTRKRSVYLTTSLLSRLATALLKSAVGELIDRVEVLRSSQPISVMSSLSVYPNTLPGQT